MSSTGARKKRSPFDIAIESLRDTNNIDIQAMKRFSGESSPISGQAGGASTNSATPGGSFLNIAGQTPMIGAIAFNPVPVTINSDGHIDITPSDVPPQKYSTYVLMTGLGTPDDLNFIDGAANNGQLLKLQGTISQVLTLKHADIGTISNIVGTTTVTVTTTIAHNMVTGEKVNIQNTTNFNIQNATITVTGANTFTYSATGSATPETSGVYQNGNIVTPDGVDIVLDGTKFANAVPYVELIFDPTVLGSGAWRVQLGAGTAGGLSEPIILTLNTITPQTLPTKSTVDWSKNPNVIALDRAVEFEFSNLPVTGKYEGVLVIIDIGATVGFASPIWPSSLTNPPTIPITANTRVSVMLYTINAGTTVTHATSVGSSVGGTEFVDNLFRVIGNGDPTKKLAFEVDTFTTATTRTFGWPNANGTVVITPMQQDLVANSFDITGLDQAAFISTVGTLGSLNVGFGALGGGGVRANVLNNGDFEITEENVLHFAFDGGTNTIRVVDALFNVHETSGVTSYSIAKFNGNTNLSEPTKVNHQIGASTIFDLTTTGITFAAGKDIRSCDAIAFAANLGNFIDDDVNGLRFTCVPTDDFTFSDGTTTFATLDVTGLNLNQLFIQMNSIVSPGVTGDATIGKIFQDSGNSNHLSIIRNGSVIDLELGGGDMVLASVQTVTGLKTFENATIGFRNQADTLTGLFTNAITATRTWTLPDATSTIAVIGLAQSWTGIQTFTSGIALGGADISGVDDINFNIAGQSIVTDASGMDFGIPTGDSFQFRVNTVNTLNINNAGIAMQEAKNIEFGTTTGSKLGASSTQKLAFWGAAPVVQPAHIIDADGTLADITTKFNQLLADLALTGQQASS